MRRGALAILTCTSWAWLACHAATAPTDARCGGYVVEGMKLLTTSQMAPEDRAAFGKRATGGQPGCFVTDFNADGIKDVALIGQERKSGAVLLMIAIANQDGSFTTAVREPLGDSMAGLFLVPHKGNKVAGSEAVDAPETVHELTGAAVEVVFVEKAAVVYFWDRAAGKIGQIQVGD